MCTLWWNCKLLMLLLLYSYRLHHPNIVELLEVHEEKTKVYLVMELWVKSLLWLDKLHLLSDASCQNSHTRFLFVLEQLFCSFNTYCFWFLLTRFLHCKQDFLEAKVFSVPTFLYTLITQPQRVLYQFLTLSIYSSLDFEDSCLFYIDPLLSLFQSLF